MTWINRANNVIIFVCNIKLSNIKQNQGEMFMLIRNLFLSKIKGIPRLPDFNWPEGI